MFLKPKIWEYEEEVRVIKNLKDCKLLKKTEDYNVYVMNIPLDSIISVTVGERISDENCLHILDKICNTHVAMYIAEIEFYGYNFRPTPIKYKQPWGVLPIPVTQRTAHLFKNAKGTVGNLARSMLKNYPKSDLINRTL